MKRNLITAALIIFALISTSCAQRANNIAAGHVSHYQYQDLDCDQLSIKMANTATTLTALSKKQDSLATTDAVAMTVGMLVFWPALIVNAATPDHKEEIADLKGKYEALEMAMAFKQCGYQDRPDPRIDPKNFAKN